MKFKLRHTTTYEYQSPVAHGRHIIRKRPRRLAHQQVEQSTVTVQPKPVWSTQEVDYFGNLVDLVEVLEPHKKLDVTVESTVTVTARASVQGVPALSNCWESVATRIARDRDCYEQREFCLDSPLVRRHGLLYEFAASTFTPGRPMLEAVVDFTARIYREFTYDSSFSDVATPLGKVLRERRGVCQDFAHVAIGALRSLGLPARYVSGYLETLPPPGKPRLVGADASHAWASVYFPDFGWVDFDPTNNVLPGEQHIVVGWGRDFSEVSPLRGVVHGGGNHFVRVSVDVARLAPEAGSNEEAQQQASRARSLQQQQHLGTCCPTGSSSMIPPPLPDSGPVSYPAGTSAPPPNSSSPPLDDDPELWRQLEQSTLVGDGTRDQDPVQWRDPSSWPPALDPNADPDQKK